MIIRRYINGKKVDVEVNAPTPPNIPESTPNTPNTNPVVQVPPAPPTPAPAVPRRRGCGCGRK